MVISANGAVDVAFAGPLVTSEVLVERGEDDEKRRRQREDEDVFWSAEH